MFSLAVGLMVILVAAFWAFQGFFSAIIMFFEAVLALAVAFGFYELVNNLFGDSLGAMGPAIALMGLFTVTLVILRLITDKIIPTGIRLPVWADRAGGGVFGLLTGLILIGTAMVAVQMLPIGPTLFGFERISADAEGYPKENNLFLKPDNFAVGLAGMLTNGRLGDEIPFEQNHPDMLVDIAASRLAPQAEARLAIPADALRVEAFWKTGQISQVQQRSPNGTEMDRTFIEQGPQDTLNTFMICKVRLNSSAAHKDRTSEIRFRIPQFRLVGPPPTSGEQAKPKVYPACGMTDIYTHQKFKNQTSMTEEQAGRIVRFSPTTDLVLAPTQTKPIAETSGGEKATVRGYVFNVAFEVPNDFKPWYVEFKQGARADLTGKKPLEGDAIASAANVTQDAKPAQEKKTGEAKTAEAKVGKATGGAFQVAVAEDAKATSKFPFRLSAKERSVRLNTRAKKLKKCSLFVTLPAPETEIEEQYIVEGLDVPDGKRIVQVYASRVAPKSILAKSINKAAGVASSITIVGDNGKTYYAIGKYAVLSRGDKAFFEIQYDPYATMPERCLKPFKQIKDEYLEKADPSKRFFAYIFLVDPGIKITKFSAGRDSQDLEIQVPN